jgi:hypothetical protein
LRKMSNENFLFEVLFKVRRKVLAEISD